MKKIYLLLLFLLVSATGYASHLVGGDLRVVFRSQTAAGPLYRIVFNLYYEDTGGGVSLPQIANLIIVSKRTGATVSTVNVEKRSRIAIVYPNTSPGCATTSVVNTGIYLYDREIVLDPAIFNDAMGYYITCTGPSNFLNSRPCSEINIPCSDFAYYTEFPRISDTGTSPFSLFTNTSPDFGGLQGDYLCLNQPFTVSYAATDIDGDQLEYDLVDPLSLAPNTPTGWDPGYSLANIFGTASAAGRMRIDRLTGVLTVTPETAGIFAFSVRCTESRNGVKIGEIRREFQYLVRATCNPIFLPVPNVPSLPVTSSGAFILDLNNGPSIDFVITGTKGMGIRSLEIIPQSANFTTQDLDINKIFDPNPNTPSSNLSFNPVTGEIKIKLIWPPCLYSRTATDIYEFDFVITDKSCPRANISTTRIKLKVLQRNNPAPKWEIMSTKNIAIIDQLADNGANVVTVPMLAGGKDTVRFTVVGRDFGDDLRIRARAFSDGGAFTLAEKGVKYTTPQLTAKDVIFSDFEWVPSCSLSRDNGRREEFVIDVYIDERSSCEKLRTTLKVKFVLEDNGVTDDYQPVNVFTPNGDSKNETYTLPELRNTKCLYKFQKITIHNRYGRPVFESSDEKFAWAAKDFPTGLYYYRIEYDNYSYKGSLQVLR